MVIVSQKLSKQVERRLREISEEIISYYKNFKRNNSRADETRCFFKVREYFRVLCEADNGLENRVLYENAEKIYCSILGFSERYSQHHKT